jgi:hypothetical protein
MRRIKFACRDREIRLVVQQQVIFIYHVIATILQY